MESSNHLDAHAKPQEAVKDVYKAFQRSKSTALATHPDLIDRVALSHQESDILTPSTTMELPSDLRRVFLDFLYTGDNSTPYTVNTAPQIFEVTAVPGLYIYPSLLPPDVQLCLLDKLLHRDLCNSEHKTNVHMHYDVPYPAPKEDGAQGSYFDSSASSLVFEAKDPSIHKHITTSQYLNKKLRWVTLGGQYDWTNKVYPSTPPPAFPPDIKQLVERVFPMKAEAAIVNLYSPGDTLSMHRDVSEECDQPLVSISLGCDGIFVVGLEGTEPGDEASVVAIRLRSGDAVLMSGESRYAWHGVPKVLEGTCPEWMKKWPCVGVEEDRVERFADWSGWMSGKRVNLNVRQMFEQR